MSSATESLTTERSSCDWTLQESKAFEVALACHFSKPDRWDRIAECIPDKNAMDVERYYQQLEDDIRLIEEGKVPLPVYMSTSSTSALPSAAMPISAAGETLGIARPAPSLKKGGGATKSAVAEATTNPADRRKGVPWTEEEHKLFLLGLAKFGKGDWRSIARNFVVSRTPTQVASHAQKYFIRLNNNNKKDKRRASIHDITSVSMTEIPTDKLSDRLGSATPEEMMDMMDLSSA